MSSFKKFVGSLNGDKVEGELVKTTLYSIIASLITLGILYFIKFKFADNFFQRYGLFFALIIISYSLLLSTIRQIRAYKKFPCMSGMMIGMTIGMVAGFLPGFFAGATNGMFFGAMFGITIGIIFGVWNGSCCGIMGIMEGIMSGFMGGLMGAMSSVMMINDHLIAASIIVTFICSVILIGLSYMIYKETIERERAHKENYFFIIITSALLSALTFLFMVFGPQGGLL